ncbi:MAG: hypothetical protein Q4G63_10070 [Bacteroidia bacterium]|nr:hypothetical protein [Bacteroidia bacterium]
MEILQRCVGEIIMWQNLPFDLVVTPKMGVTNFAKVPCWAFASFTSGAMFRAICILVSIVRLLSPVSFEVVSVKLESEESAFSRFVVLLLCHPPLEPTFVCG